MYALKQNIVKEPSQLGKFIKSWLRYPVSYAAERTISAVPAVSFTDIFPEAAEPTHLFYPGKLERSEWNARMDEKIYIGLMIQAINAKAIFEIGTFDGGTTLHMAGAAGESSHIYTLDFPPQEFDLNENPALFNGMMIGHKYKGEQGEERITQLFGNSVSYDYSPYLGKMDFVFVDAAHDYFHGLSDSRTALKLVRPGGVVVWHDFTSYWSGLIHAICEATSDYSLVTLASTSLAIVRTEG